MIFPWHASLWQRMMVARQQQRLPHAMLLCGPMGMGKSLFAERLAHTLLCDHPDATTGQPCGQCKPCHLLQVHNHSDLLIIQPPEEGKQIQVDSIRGLIQFCSLTAHYGHHQIIILNPAEAMNQNAANSLLKLLEEPSAKTLLLLISHQPSALLATIRSRCQRADFSRPDKTITLSWLRSQIAADVDAQLLLNLTAQAPLAALELVKTEQMDKRRLLFDSLTQLPEGREDPIGVASQWNQLDPLKVLSWMLSWTIDLIRYTASRQPSYLVNQDYREALQRLGNQLDLQKLFRLLDLQKEVYQLIRGTANVKPQGLLETIAIAWFELKIQRRT